MHSLGECLLSETGEEEMKEGERKKGNIDNGMIVCDNDGDGNLGFIKDSLSVFGGICHVYTTIYYMCIADKYN